MSKIASQLTSLHAWLGGNPMCDRDRTRIQIMVTLPEVRYHTQGI